MAIDDQGRFMGRDRFLYASLTQPVTPTDPTGYTKVGLADGLSSNVSGETVAPSDRGSGGFTSTHTHTKSNTVEVSGSRKNVGDEGMVLLEDAANDPTDPTVYYLISSNVEGDRCEYGAVSVSSFDKNDDAGSIATYSATLNGRGAKTITTVPAAV